MHKKNIIGEITQNVIKGELSFLYTTHCHDLFYITVKYHQNIPKGIQVIVLTGKCLRTDNTILETGASGNTLARNVFNFLFRDRKET